MTQVKSSHLRLVPNNNQTSNKAVHKKSAQLAFPYPDPTAMILVDVNCFSRPDFINLLKSVMPKKVIDVRVLPRLDMLTGSRAYAFQLFKHEHIVYIDLFGRLNISSYNAAESNPAFWFDSLIKTLSDGERSGPYLFLFDDPKLMQAAESVLAVAMGQFVGSKVSVSVLSA